MKRNVLPLMLALALPLGAGAMKTAGDGTTYTLDLLSQLDPSGVEKYVDEDDGEVIYTMYANDTIAAGDKFVMEDGVTLLFDDEVLFVIEGEADFSLSRGSFFDSAYDDADYVSPEGIKICNEQSQTEFANCQFYRVGLRCASSKGLKVTDCAFYYNNGAIGQAALTLGTDGAPFEVTGCTFAYCRKAAIAGAANYYNPLLVKDCTFEGNGQANGNTPQLNLTVSSSVVVENCTITGDPSLTMVGGIGISNFSAVAGSSILVKGCHITDCRYGIGTVGPVNITIEDNTFIDNHYEQNAMNGGSGISLYDPYKQTTARITGNHIEGSLWGITVIGCKDVNAGRTDVDESDSRYNRGGNTFVNNGNGGQLYDLYNNSDITVYAQNNTWNVSEQTQEQIEQVIFHQSDDSSLGQVIFMPAAATTAIRQATSQAHDGAAYGLNGMPMPKNGRKGIVIRDGKKWF